MAHRDYVYPQVPSQCFPSLCIISIWSYLIVGKQIFDLAEELQASDHWSGRDFKQGQLKAGNPFSDCLLWTCHRSDTLIKALDIKIHKTQILHQEYFWLGDSVPCVWYFFYVDSTPHIPPLSPLIYQIISLLQNAQSTRNSPPAPFISNSACALR